MLVWPRGARLSSPPPTVCSLDFVLGSGSPRPHLSPHTTLTPSRLQSHPVLPSLAPTCLRAFEHVFPLLGRWFLSQVPFQSPQNCPCRPTPDSLESGTPLLARLGVCGRPRVWGEIEAHVCQLGPGLGGPAVSRRQNSALRGHPAQAPWRTWTGQGCSLWIWGERKRRSSPTLGAVKSPTSPREVSARLPSPLRCGLGTRPWTQATRLPFHHQPPPRTP